MRFRRSLRLPRGLVPAPQPDVADRRHPMAPAGVVTDHPRHPEPRLVEPAALTTLTPRAIHPHETHDTEPYGVLDCGHPDDDPTSWHDTPDGHTVCSTCCPTCGDH